MLRINIRLEFVNYEDGDGDGRAEKPINTPLIDGCRSFAKSGDEAIESEECCERLRCPWIERHSCIDSPLVLYKPSLNSYDRRELGHILANEFCVQSSLLRF